jgi:hypothetical protein
MALILRAMSAEEIAAASSFKLYHYDPTIAGAVIFVLLFLATTGLHFWQMFKSRCWFLLPLVVGGICEYFHLSDSTGGVSYRVLMWASHSGGHWLCRPSQVWE